MASERDLFANFERMRREMDELLGDLFDRAGMAPGRPGFSPAVDVYYCGEPTRVIVKAEVAGINLDELAIEIRGRELIIAGQRPPAESEGHIFQQVEIERGAFRRAVQLGIDVVADQAKAVYEDGVLKIEIPIEQPENRSHEVPIEVPQKEA